jgi:hypothetical protein
MRHGFHFISGLPRAGSTLLAGIPSPVGTLFAALLGQMSQSNELPVLIKEAQREAILIGLFENMTQNAFSGSGANSLRSTIGAELAGEQPLSAESKLSLALRLGGLREYDNTNRPISAAVADATSVYLRYDGEAGSGTDNHPLDLGLRVL